MSTRTATVLTMLRESLEHRGYPPTLREIASAMGVTSTNGVRWHLKKLVKAGLIEIDPKRARGIRLTGEGHAYFDETKVYATPLMTRAQRATSG